MADSNRPTKKRHIKKTPQSVRQRAESVANAKPKPRRIRKATTKASKPFRSAYHFGRKEIYLPLPDNRVGRFLNKRRYFVPRYFKESWKELRQVTWPNRKETTKLTIAVFTFAIVFGLLIAFVDFGLDKLFKLIFLD